jgi:hypothetical protein
MDWQERLKLGLRIEYGRDVDLDDIEPSPVPGFWRRRSECTGGRCGLPPHRPFIHTLRFMDPTVDPSTGRFASPFRTWREASGTAKAAG